MRAVALACILMLAPFVLAQEVASTSKSGQLVEKQFWDKQNTQPKLYREYYELKKFDKDDNLISTEQVRHGNYVEWNKTGKQKRTMRALADIPEWYFRLIETYEDGVVTYRNTFHASGAPAAREEFEDGKLARRESNFDSDDAFNDGPRHKEELFRADGSVLASSEWRRDGRPLRLEEAAGDQITRRTLYEYHANGDEKLVTETSFQYQYDPATKKHAPKEFVRLTATSDKGLQTVTLDGVKVSEGRLVALADGKKSKRLVKDGEWKYWDVNGKLTKAEKWNKGELVETREYK